MISVRYISERRFRQNQRKIETFAAGPGTKQVRILVFRIISLGILSVIPKAIAGTNYFSTTAASTATAKAPCLCSSPPASRSHGEPGPPLRSPEVQPLTVSHVSGLRSSLHWVHSYRAGPRPPALDNNTTQHIAICLTQAA